MTETTHDSDSEQLHRAELWTGDLGVLQETSRRALLELVQGPYLSGSLKPKLWAALLADTDAIRSRLHDLFLDLVFDPTDEFAFVRPANTGDLAAPSAVRTAKLTFMDTLMLITLRQLLLSASGDRRVIVGKDELIEQLAPYRAGRDDADFSKRVNSSWAKLSNKLGLLHDVGHDRAEISPVVAVIVDDDRARAITSEFERIASDQT